jgi:hypothetical protein
MKKEILEKLQEIGFNPEPPILETILEALPKHNNFLTDYDYILAIIDQNYGNELYIGYQNEEDLHQFFTVKQQKNESLADTAARLLILLESKNIIKFKE